MLGEEDDWWDQYIACEYKNALYAGPLRGLYHLGEPSLRATLNTRYNNYLIDRDRVQPRRLPAELALPQPTRAHPSSQPLTPPRPSHHAGANKSSPAHSYADNSLAVMTAPARAATASPAMQSSQRYHQSQVPDPPQRTPRQPYTGTGTRYVDCFVCKNRVPVPDNWENGSCMNCDGDGDAVVQLQLQELERRRQEYERRRQEFEGRAHGYNNGSQLGAGNASASSHHGGHAQHMQSNAPPSQAAAALSSGIMRPTTHAAVQSHSGNFPGLGLHIGRPGGVGLSTPQRHQNTVIHTPAPQRAPFNYDPRAPYSPQPPHSIGYGNPCVRSTSALPPPRQPPTAGYATPSSRGPPPTSYAQPPRTSTPSSQGLPLPTSYGQASRPSSDAERDAALAKKRPNASYDRVNRLLCAECGKDAPKDTKERHQNTPNNGVHCTRCCTTFKKEGRCIWEEGQKALRKIESSKVDQGVLRVIVDRKQHCDRVKQQEPGRRGCLCTPLDVEERFRREDDADREMQVKREAQGNDHALDTPGLTHSSPDPSPTTPGAITPASGLGSLLQGQLPCYGNAVAGQKRKADEPSPTLQSTKRINTGSMTSPNDYVSAMERSLHMKQSHQRPATGSAEPGTPHTSPPSTNIGTAEMKKEPGMSSRPATPTIQPNGLSPAVQQRAAPGQPAATSTQQTGQTNTQSGASHTPKPYAYTSTSYAATTPADRNATMSSHQSAPANAAPQLPYANYKATGRTATSLSRELLPKAIANIQATKIVQDLYAEAWQKYHQVKEPVIPWDQKERQVHWSYKADVTWHDFGWHTVEKAEECPACVSTGLGDWPALQIMHEHLRDSGSGKTIIAGETEADERSRAEYCKSLGYDPEAIDAEMRRKEEEEEAWHENMRSRLLAELTK